MVKHNNQGKTSRGSAGNNRKTGEDFLAKNKMKPGVTETASGLQYMVVEPGVGDCPGAKCSVEIHQRCTLINGTIIEDTYRENKTSKADIAELIEGYAEGLMLMNKGARFKLYIPPSYNFV